MKSKILKISLITITIIIAVIISVPFLFKDKIISSLQSTINKNIKAKVSIGDAGVSFFRNFPYLTLSVDQVSIAGINEFEGDTLLKAESVSASADLWSVISGDKIRIRSIYVNDANIRLIVLKDGSANWDIAISDTAPAAPGASKPMQIELKRYGIKNSNISYDDREMGLLLDMKALNHSGSGDFADELFKFRTVTEIEKTKFVFGGVTYLNDLKTSLKADLDMDMKAMKFSFLENELKLNNLILGMNGFIAMPGDPIEMDLKFNVKENSFGNFMSVVPGAFKKDFDKAKSGGTLALNGFLKGSYSQNSMPGFGLNVKINGGTFSYPDLPVALSNVAADLSINNPDGIPDHTLINLQKFHMEIGKDAFDARVMIKTPVTDPQIDASMKGVVDLGSVSKMFPLEADTKLGGRLEADIAASGRMSAIENKRFQYFRAEGFLSLASFNYSSKDFSQGVSIPSAELIFNPKNITLNKFELSTGKTTLNATGWIDNLMGYVFKENELLSGTMDLRANLIDLNDFMSTNIDSTKTESKNSGSSVLAIPANIDFTLTATCAKVIYKKLELTNAAGNLAIRDRALGLNGLSFNTLDGKVSMNGVYDTKEIKKPFFGFSFNVEGLDVKKTWTAFESVKKMAPVAEQCKGNYLASMEIKGDLDQKMEPVYSSLTGGGKLSSNNIEIENFKPLAKVAEVMKMEQFRKFSPGPINISFKFENGRVNVEPFDVNIAGMKTNVSGSNGFDQTIDYNLITALPTKIAGQAALGAINNLLSKANQAIGTNLNVGSEIKVRLHLTGTVKDPKVELGSGNNKASSTSSDDLKSKIDAGKKELETKARLEADRLKAEAEAKAKNESERIKKEVEEKAKNEADRLKKEMEEKAKKEAADKLKNLFGKPKK